MILCEFTPDGGSLARISTEDNALTYQWLGLITSFSSMKLQTSKKYGGYAKPTFSDITISPELFDGAWPPARSATVTIKQTDTTEAAAVTLLTGTATRGDFDRSGVKYTFKQPEFSATIAKSTAYSGALDTVVDTLCGVGILNLTVDHTNERTIMPAVSYTTTADIQAIDLLSDMCAFFTHGFKIISGTLYLYDLLATTTAVALTEFDIKPSKYKNGEPVSLITCEDDSVAGSNPNGDEMSVPVSYATVGVNTEAALTNIKTIVEHDIATISAKISDTGPTVLDYVTLTDESTIGDTVVAGRVMSAIYNYDTLDAGFEVYGVIT